MAADPRLEFERIVEEVFDPLQRYLRRRAAADDVDDLVNEVLTVVWRRLDQVPAGSELAWTYGVARRTLANHRRGHRRRLRLVDRAATFVDEREAPRWTESSDVALQVALDRLGELDREIVRLWAWERLEPRDIAAVVGSTPNAVSARLTRARARLASEIVRQDRHPAGHRPDDTHPEPGS